MVVNLTPLDNGDPDLYLNKNNTKLPTKSEHDLESTDPSGDFIFVDKNTFKSEQGIAGYYIVGVYGEIKSTYMI